MSIEIRTNKSDIIRKDYPIDMVELADLIPHEMTIGYELEKFKKSIIETNQLNWPLIVDRETKLILDGHHRHQGLAELDFRDAPAVFLDYGDDDLIKVDTWYPLVEVPLLLVVRELQEIGCEMEKVPKIDLDDLKQRKFTALVGNINELYQVSGDREKIFGIIRDKWLDQIKYYDDPNHCLKSTGVQHSAVISWSYNKREIIDHAIGGGIYLPKTTRHYLKYEVKRCDMSLDKLRK